MGSFAQFSISMRTMCSTTIITCLLVTLVTMARAMPLGQQGYGYSSSYPLQGQASYSSYPSYQGSSYQSSYPSYQQSYPSYPNQPFTQSYSYPSYQPSYSSWSYQPSSYSYQSQQHQAPVYNYMINDLPMNYFRPESSSSSSSSSIASSSSSSTPVSSVSVSAKLTARSPAWQGKIDGSGRTRCHDGKILPFRARCNKVVDCDGGEDEYDCDWHKRSFIPTIDSVDHFKSVMANNEKVLVEFFAPWCPACVTFLPELEKVANSAININLKVFKVNTDENQELKNMYSVNTFPRVLLFNKKAGTEPVV